MKALLVALLLTLAASPVWAAQGTGPTTDITGPIDHSTPDQRYAQGGCMPAGGSAIPDPELPADQDFVLVGGGWGHGGGMSQYGAQGAATLGCTAEQILTTYFTGTAISSVAQPGLIVIGLAQEVTTTDLRAAKGTIPYELCHYQTHQCTPLPVQQPEGATWRVAIQADASYVITDVANGAEVFRGGDYEHNLRAVLSPDSDTDRRLNVSNTGHTYRWGVVQLDSVQDEASDAFVTLEIPGMDLYLRGLAEVPASWPSAALQAQAITGRSYALHRMNALGIRDACRCHLYATPRDQNYEGYDHEVADAQGGGRWASAVIATSGQVLTYQGAICETFYSSSHGGWSESSRFVFGGELPYVQAVDDSRWDLASTNPYRRWAVGFAAEDLGGATGVGEATGMELLEPRGAGGRVGHPDRGYGGVRITGTEGSVVLSGDQLKAALGLRSTLVDLRRTPGAEPPPPSEPPPPPAPPPPDSPDLLDRVSSGDRIGTAVEVSRSAWASSGNVILAAADRFPDALAGVALAAMLDAPLLLTNRNALPDQVAAEIQRLGAQTAWLLGGPAAIATPVRGTLSDMGIMTRRLYGDDRYQTAAEIARAVTGAAPDVVLALGEDWPDAVSASSLGALAGGPPTLLTRRDEVPAPTLAALSDLGAASVTLVGGTAVISQAVVDQLEAGGYTVRRLAGSSRYATSAAVAGDALTTRGGSAPLIVAAGTGFADALSAGALAARMDGVLLLAPRDTLDQGPDARAFVQARRGVLAGGVVVGGTAVISQTVESQLEQALAG